MNSKTERKVRRRAMRWVKPGLVLLGATFVVLCGVDTAHAALDDALLGMRHLHDFERVAVVSDHQWLTNSIRIFGPLMSAHIKVFALDEMDEAKPWVAW